MDGGRASVGTAGGRGVATATPARITAAPTGSYQCSPRPAPATPSSGREDRNQVGDAGRRCDAPASGDHAVVHGEREPGAERAERRARCRPRPSDRCHGAGGAPPSSGATTASSTVATTSWAAASESPESDRPAMMPPRCTGWRSRSRPRRPAHMSCPIELRRRRCPARRPSTTSTPAKPTPEPGDPARGRPLGRQEDQRHQQHHQRRGRVPDAGHDRGDPLLPVPEQGERDDVADEGEQRHPGPQPRGRGAAGRGSPAAARAGSARRSRTRPSVTQAGCSSRMPTLMNRKLDPQIAASATKAGSQALEPDRRPGRSMTRGIGKGRKRSRVLSCRTRCDRISRRWRRARVAIGSPRGTD